MFKTARRAAAPLLTALVLGACGQTPGGTGARPASSFTADAARRANPFAGLEAKFSPLAVLCPCYDLDAKNARFEVALFSEDGLARLTINQQVIIEGGKLVEKAVNAPSPWVLGVEGAAEGRKPGQPDRKLAVLRGLGKLYAGLKAAKVEASRKDDLAEVTGQLKAWIKANAPKNGKGPMVLEIED